MFKFRRSYNFLKNNKGFTVIDLIVSISIIIILFSFVLVNFNTAENIVNFEGIVKKIVNGVTTVRNMNLGGQLIDNPVPPPNEIFPDGGYGIRFEILPSPTPDEVTLFAVDTTGEIEIDKFELDKIEFIEFCGLTDDTVASGLPCEGNWDTLSQSINPLEIIFSAPGEITAVPSEDNFSTKFIFVGGKIRHTETGQEAYFYVSVLSGLVVSDFSL
ncbi:MAG: hypothetical protein CMI53_01095 [Parcubacteria group bacterium]|nr:hypothetical protein [Parcubacteria group bacterium]|tara:strand:- start:9572 stop:10216 length:645 start_codon:yes stop_codon:yes gene_type:complete